MALTIDGQLDVATSNEYIYSTVSGFVVAAISGQPVTISGDTIITNISGQLTTYSGIGVAVQSGYGVLTNISGQSVVTSISGQSVAVDFSGLTVTASISGQPVLISGQWTTYSGIGVAVQSGYGVVTDVSGQWTTYSGIGVTVQSGYGVLASISGQSVKTTISGEPIWEHDLYPVWTGRKYRVDAWNNNISKPSTLEILIKTSSRVVHCEYRFLTGGEGSLVFYENPTVTSNGLLFSYINTNRASSEVPVTTVYTGGKHTSGTGTRLALDYLAVPQPSFAGFAPKEEYILNTSGTYLLVFNAVGTNLPIGLTMYYWEDV